MNELILAAAITIMMPTGQWSVTNGYIVTNPEGHRLACGLAESTLKGGKEVELDCVPFEDTIPMTGLEDGELIPR